MRNPQHQHQQPLYDENTPYIYRGQIAGSDDDEDDSDEEDFSADNLISIEDTYREMAAF